MILKLVLDWKKCFKFFDNKNLQILKPKIVYFYTSPSRLAYEMIYNLFMIILKPNMPFSIILSDNRKILIVQSISRSLLLTINITYFKFQTYFMKYSI